MDQADTLPHRISQFPYQLVEGEGFRAGGVHGHVLIALTILRHQRRHVIHEYRLESVAAVPRDAEHGEPPQEPGDVVQQDVFPPKDDGRAQDGVRKAGRPDVCLELRLPVEIRQRRTERRVGDAHVDEPPDARLHRRIDQDLRVPDGTLEGGLPVIETDPVGVVQGPDPLQ
jgi:hypothetical protein